jgi:hypothetical protein
MKKDDITKAKKIIEKFDPTLVALAIQHINVKAEDVERAKKGIRNAYESIPMTEDKRKVLSEAVAEVNAELMEKEINNIKVALKDFDKKVIAEATKEYLDSVGLLLYCNHTICICPEGGCIRYNICAYPLVKPPRCLFKIGGCRYEICICPEGWPFADFGIEGLDIRELEHVGLSQLKAMRDLDNNKGVSTVVRIGSRVGHVGLCYNPVKCTGRAITIMHKCAVNLYAFDVGGVIDPVEALLKVAESDPKLHKRINRMVEEMKKADEL